MHSLLRNNSTKMQAKKKTYIGVPKLFANGSNVRLPEEANVILGHRRHVLAQVVTAVAHDVLKDKFRSTSSGSGAVAACSLWRCKPVWGCDGCKQPPARQDSPQVHGVWVFGNLVKGFSAFWPFCCWLLE